MCRPFQTGGVVEQRQKAAIEPRQRPDRKDYRQHEEGTGAKSADA